MNSTQWLRIARSYFTITLILETMVLIAGFLAGARAGLLAPAAFILACLALIPLTDRKIQARETPRPGAIPPDYTMIALMEYEVYGRVFQHDGAPGISGEPAREVPARQDCATQAREAPADTTVPATAAQYAAWLRGYIRHGGTITHGYDYPFANARFRYAASGPVTIDSRNEFGAHSRNIIAGRGVKVERTDPDRYFSGWGHTSVFYTSGHRTNSRTVPVYSDPEFDDLRHLAKNRY